MSAATLEKIFGVIGVILVTGFVLGLAESISAGAAGFWGGLPFWVICFLVLVLVVYDFGKHACARSKGLPATPTPCPRQALRTSGT